MAVTVWKVAIRTVWSGKVGQGMAVMEWKVTLDMVCLGTAVVVRTGALGQGRLGRGQAVVVR
jgi:hypothetical protein